MARRCFGFLEELGARPEEAARSTDVVIVYVLEELTFEIELDWCEGAAFVLVCRTIDSARPAGYTMFHGVRVRMQLADAMSAACLDGEGAVRQLRAVMKVGGPDAMAAQLSVYGELLKDCVDTLLSEARAIYPEDRG